MIDVKEFEALKGKVETLKEKQAKASGTMEATEKQLADLGVTDLDTIDSLITDKRTECDALEKDLAADYAELKGLHSWQFV